MGLPERDTPNPWKSAKDTLLESLLEDMKIVSERREREEMDPWEYEAPPESVSKSYHFREQHHNFVTGRGIE